MSPATLKKHGSTLTSLYVDTLNTTRPAACEGLFSCIEPRSNHAILDTLPQFYERQVLPQLDENLSLKCGKQPKKSATPATIPLKPTQDNLLVLKEQSDIGTASFLSEVRSRNLQEAGKSMGFNLKLDCYEPIPVSIEDWCESQNTLLEDRPILKDPQDLAEMATIAKAFETALVQDAHEHFQG